MTPESQLHSNEPMSTAHCPDFIPIKWEGVVIYKAGEPVKDKKDSSEENTLEGIIYEVPQITAKATLAVTKHIS